MSDNIGETDVQTTTDVEMEERFQEMARRPRIYGVVALDPVIATAVEFKDRDERIRTILEQTRLLIHQQLDEWIERHEGVVSLS